MTATLENQLLACTGRSSWARWLVTSTQTGARETLAFLQSAWSGVPPEGQRRIAKRLRQADPSGVDAVLHELLVFEVCSRSRFQTVFEPQAGRQRPDLEIRVGGHTYIADVFLTNRPVSTRVRFEGLNGYVDSGEAAKKIADGIRTKALRYATLQKPLLLFVVFGGHDVGLRHLETALYGSTLDEIEVSGGITAHCHEEWQRHGVLCPPGPAAAHKLVSAVVSCDWFDTLNRSRPGRRLHCVVYHHWQPHISWPSGALSPFSEVRWDLSAEMRFRPTVLGVGNLVLETTSTTGLSYAPYSADDPW